MKGYKAVILPDVHISDKGYSQVYEPVKKFIRQFKPDKIVLLGDFADCGALSHWNLEKRRKVEGRRHEKELDVIDGELEYLKRYTKSIIWIEGNHENWVEQYIDKHPEVEGMLEYRERLNLEARGIKWVPMNQLYKMGNLYFTHGMYISMHHAKKHLMNLGCNICYGHTHVAQVHSHSMRMQEPYRAWGLGCLCDHEPAYLRGKRGCWDDQFAILYVASNDDFNLYPIDIIKNRFYYGGKRYD